MLEKGSDSHLDKRTTEPGYLTTEKDMLKILLSNKSTLILSNFTAEKQENYEFHKPTEESNTQKRKPLESIPIPDRNIQQTAYLVEDSTRKMVRTSHKKLDGKGIGHTPTNLSKLIF